MRICPVTSPRLTIRALEADGWLHRHAHAGAAKVGDLFVTSPAAQAVARSTSGCSTAPSCQQRPLQREIDIPP